MTIATIRFAGTTQAYLQDYFCDETSLARLSNIDVDRLRMLVAEGMVPDAAYVVANGRIASHVFGHWDAPGAPSGRWFSRANAAWIQRAIAVIAEQGQDAAKVALKVRFECNYREALRASHTKEGPLPGLSQGDGGFDDAGFDAQFDAVWAHFLAGTFSLCVRDAVDESRIATKEALQLRLSAATDGGTRTRYSDAETRNVRSLIARYIEASMPFSPIEYPLSSRRRLVEDVLPHLRPD